MKNRVLIVACSIFILLILGAIFIYFYPHNTSKNASNIVGVQHVPQVTLILQEDTKVATYSDIVAHTPYEALTIVSQQHTIPVKTKQYDFGLFVEAIGTKESNKDFSWLYFVNDISGTVAADKKELKKGDVVTWKYEKIHE
jgi:hypothetical protein